MRKYINSVYLTFAGLLQARSLSSRGICPHPWECLMSQVQFSLCTVQTLFAHQPMMYWSCKPDAVEVTIVYGERCIFVDGITQATRCKDLFSHLELLTGSKIPENAQMWANGRVLRRQQTIEEVQLNVDKVLSSWYCSFLKSSPKSFRPLTPFLSA